MANQETAYGMRPVGLVGAGVNSTGVTEYEIASNNTNAIYQYEIVVPLAAGVIDQAGATNGGTTQALGVLMGVQYHDSVQKKPVWLNYWPGSGSVSVDTNHPVKAFVADNPKSDISGCKRRLVSLTVRLLWLQFLQILTWARQLVQVAQTLVVPVRLPA